MNLLVFSERSSLRIGNKLSWFKNHNGYSYDIQSGVMILATPSHQV